MFYKANEAAIKISKIPAAIEINVGVEIPESGNSGCVVGVLDVLIVALGVADAVAVAFGVALGVGELVALGVDFGVAVGIPVAIGLVEGDTIAILPIVKVNGSHEIAVCKDSLADGLLSGAVGDAADLFFCSSNAVKIAIPAKTAVSVKIETVIIVFLFIFLKPS